MVEREEGIFTRQGATRVLCLLACLGWIAMTAILLLVIYFTVRRGATPGMYEGIVLLILPLSASALSIAILSIWRRCDRCRRRLFAEGRRVSFARTMLRDNPWINKIWWMKNEPERDYRARAFLGSYRNGAILQMALTGRLRCQWCGHEDGAAPDYVVTARQ